MSLALPECRDIILHRVNETAVVVYNPSSRSIWRRDVALHESPTDIGVCPTCGQALSYQVPSADYFRLLGRVQREQASQTSQSTPRGAPESEVNQTDEPRTEFGAESESPEAVLENWDSGPDGISKVSLTQGYFDRFFKSLGLLGRGSRAAVYLVEHELEGVSVGKFALKKIPVGNNHKWLEKVLAEVNLLGSLAHPNLVRYNHVWLEVSSFSRFGPAVPCAYVLQEYCDAGTLEDFVFARVEELKQKRSKLLGRRLSIVNGREDLRSSRNSRRDHPASSGDLSSDGRDVNGNEARQAAPLSYAEIYSFMSDILRGLIHLHEHGFLHCDLKPSNCLLQTREGTIPAVLVSDFGESQREGSTRIGTGATGTLEYTAPEMLIPVDGVYPPFSKSSDMFSVGMILHFLCFAQLPYSDAWEAEGDLQQLKNEVRQFQFDFDASVQEAGRLDLEPLRPLMCSLLGDPRERPTAGTVLKQLQLLRESDARFVSLPLNPPDAVAPPGDPVPAAKAVAVSVLVPSNSSVPATGTTPPTKRRRVEPQTSENTKNILRAVKILGVYALRPRGWMLHGCAALAVAELFLEHPREFFVAHWVLLLASWGAKASPFSL